MRWILYYMWYFFHYVCVCMLYLLCYVQQNLSYMWWYCICSAFKFACRKHRLIYKSRLVIVQQIKYMLQSPYPLYMLLFSLYTVQNHIICRTFVYKRSIVPRLLLKLAVQQGSLRIPLYKHIAAQCLYIGQITLQHSPPPCEDLSLNH